MIGIIVFFVIFSSFNAFGTSVEEERLNREWMETGFSLDYVITKMISNCHRSEKFFVGCMMSLHYMVSNANKDDPWQLRVSDLNNELEIVPYPEKKDLDDRENLLISNSETFDDFLAFKVEHTQKRRKSFQTFFRSKKSENPEGQPFFIKDFRGVLQRSVEFVQNHVPEESQPRFMGEVYNILLQESVDPHAAIYPAALQTRKQTMEYVGVGMINMKYRTDNKDLNNLIVIDPMDGSPAKAAGLKKGDLLLAVDGVSVKTQTLDQSLDRIGGHENTQVTLTVREICNNNNKRTVSITRKPIIDSFDLLKNSRFINVLEETPLDCESESLTVNQAPQALYVPLVSFEETTGKEKFHLCGEFVELQKRDLQNPRSLGMIIDLRQNVGGQAHIALCLLNTIISGTDVMLKSLPIVDGKVRKNGQGMMSYRLTDAGSMTHPDNPTIPVSYNKHIVVLVDESSASASEIFAGVIQEKKRGWIVGERTFGKGSIQKGEPLIIPNPKGKHLVMKKTTHVYVFGNDWSPHNHGIIPDFHFSKTGQPMEYEKDGFVSIEQRVYSNGIEFGNHNPWTQNRPDEVAELNNCVHRENTMSSRFLDKVKNDERYRRPMVADYPLELAKDILACSKPTDPYGFHYRTYNFENVPFLVEIRRSP